jgi:peptidoglycan hydrolase-like protein with peptidoglycan-binding domain
LRSPKLTKTAIALTLALLLALPALAASKSSKRSSHKSGHKATKVSAKSGSRHHAKRARRGAWKRHGQQGITGDRAREIQAALIRERYLDGEANGVWDSRTQAAMQKFQADNGWQSKVLPDSRALIKLGLGPDHSGLLNPETAAIPVAASGEKPPVGNIQQ